MSNIGYGHRRTALGQQIANDANIQVQIIYDMFKVPHITMKYFTDDETSLYVKVYRNTLAGANAGLRDELRKVAVKIATFKLTRVNVNITARGMLELEECRPFEEMMEDTINEIFKADKDADLIRAVYKAEEENIPAPVMPPQPPVRFPSFIFTGNIDTPNLDLHKKCQKYAKVVLSHMKSHPQHPRFDSYTPKNVVKMKNYVDSVLGTKLQQTEMDMVLDLLVNCGN